MEPTTILIFVAIAGIIVFQVFQGRKRKRETEAKLSQFLPGVEIMTNYGLYGTIVDIDDEKNLVTLEVSPGVEVKIHKQTMLKVADYDDVAELEPDTDADAEEEITDDRSISLEKPLAAPTTPAFSALDPVTEPAPAYGERIVETSDAAGSTPVVDFGSTAATLTTTSPVTSETSKPAARRKPARRPAASTPAPLVDEVDGAPGADEVATPETALSDATPATTPAATTRAPRTPRTTTPRTTTPSTTPARATTPRTPRASSTTPRATPARTKPSTAPDATPSDTTPSDSTPS